MTTAVRGLGPDDMAAIEAFCLERPNTTLFPRDNALALTAYQVIGFRHFGDQAIGSFHG